MNDKVIKMICDKCKVKEYCSMAGQGFRTWTCKICGHQFVHHNTNVPKVCGECSKRYNVCTQCGEKING